MSTEKALFVCTIGFRPRVDGKVQTIAIGQPFEKDMIDAHTFESFLKAGHITPFNPVVEDAVILEEKVAEDVVEEPVKKKPAQRKKASKKKAPVNKPTGIFNLKADDLADKNLDELDSIHAVICSDNKLNAPEPFESIEKAVDKLTSEG